MGRVISDGFVQNAMALGETWRARRKDAKIRNAMAGFEEDPEDAARQVFKIDPDMGFKVKKIHEANVDRETARAEKARETKMGNLKSIAGYLRGQAKKDPAGLGAAYDGMTDVFRNTMDMEDDEIAHYRAAILQNPGMLNQLAGDDKDNRPVVMAAGAELVDPDDPSTIMHRVPYAPQNMQVPNAQGGKDVIQVPKEPGGAPPAGARTTRLANPGAVKDGPFARSQPGYAGSDGVFAKFDTPEAGAAAQTGLLKNAYLAKGFDTPSKIVNRYAPVGPENSAESVRNYIGHVTSRMGIGPNDVIPAERAGELAGIMAEFEGGSGPAPIKPIYSTGGKAKEVKPGYTIATQEQKVAAGVDPKLPWQISGEGKMELIGPAATVAKPGKKLPIPTQASFDASVAGLQRLADQANTLMKHKGLERITGLTGIAPNFPGGQAADAEAELQTLKSQIAFSVLQNMRDMSKTGGALGNVSNYEIAALERNLAGLDTKQGYPSFKRNLQKIMDYVSSAQGRLRSAYEQQTGGSLPAGGKAPRVIKSPTQGALARLKGNPSGVERKLFDQVFGSGAAAKALGK